MTVYRRIILTGTLRTLSPLHIGTGNEEILSNDNKSNIDENSSSSESISYNALCLDADNQPYIPASSLRGYLRDIISQHQEDALNDLFGLARQESDNKEDINKESGNIGALRVYDALWGVNQATSQAQLISQTSINPLTATAKEHHLLTHAVVDSNSVFDLTIELDNASQQQLTLILKALNTLGQEYGGKLGKAKTSGQGSISWEHKELKVLTEEKFIKWLEPKNTKSLSAFYQSYLVISEMNTLVEEAKAQAFVNNSKQITVTLAAQSPILINDPKACTEIAKQREKNNKDTEKDKDKNSADLLFIPDLLFSQANKQAIIPGSSLKGWVRAQCRKILLTLINSADSTLENNLDVDAIVNKLFGSTEQQGLIEFNHARASFTEDEIHQQTFTAIDRFTGGVKPGALYQAEAIWPKEPFSLQIRYQDNKLKDWMRLLLLFMIRDAAQGDLILGWGKSKGYGRLILSSTQYSDWQSLYKTLDAQTLEAWQNDLDKVLGLQQKMQENTQEANA